MAVKYTGSSVDVLAQRAGPGFADTVGKASRSIEERVNSSTLSRLTPQAYVLRNSYLEL
jgi:hypothetical protein